MIADFMKQYINGHNIVVLYTIECLSRLICSYTVKKSQAKQITRDGSGFKKI